MNEVYIPKYIKQELDYKKGERVTSEEYNNLLNLLITASDYNTAILNKLCTDADFNLIMNAHHADEAEHALVAEDSNRLSGATLSRASQGNLVASDDTVPSSKQVTDAIGNVVNAVATRFDAVNNNLDTLNTWKQATNNRLSNIDLINTQYGIRIPALENRLTTAERDIVTVRNDNVTQDQTLAEHNARITNLELGEVPEDVLSTLMTKGSYVYNDSADTVKKAYTALNLLVDGNITDPATLASKTAVETLATNSFVYRGELPNPNGAHYTVGEIKALKMGAYNVTSEQAAALCTRLEGAGTLRLYPSGTGLSLEFEESTDSKYGLTCTCYIPQSVTDNTLLSDINWVDMYQTITALSDAITNISTLMLTANQLKSGTDIEVVSNSGNLQFNYTGPKIVISETEPPSDPERPTLWVQL